MREYSIDNKYMYYIIYAYKHMICFADFYYVAKDILRLLI